MLYFPLLRTKKGELDALLTLNPATKDQIRPILQIPPPDLTRDNPPKEVPPNSTFVAKMATSLRDVCAVGSGLVCYLDPAPAGLTPTLLDELLRHLAAYPQQPLPVFDFENLGVYPSLYTSVFGQPDSAVLRVNINNTVPTTTDIQAVMAAAGLTPAQTILLLDAGDVSPKAHPLKLIEGALASAVVQAAPLGLDALVVASCALPMGADLTKWVATKFVRKEIELFRAVKIATRQELQFGDYATGNTITGPAPSQTGAPKVRYTLATEYHVIRGEKTGRGPLEMTQQYHRLSQHIVSLGTPHYPGRHFSWGDDHIFKSTVPGSAGRGNATTWVKANTSHHIELVASMLPSM